MTGKSKIGQAREFFLTRYRHAGKARLIWSERLIYGRIDPDEVWANFSVISKINTVDWLQG